MAKTALAEKPESKVREPRLFSVIFHNDDYTTVDFVVHLLIVIFRKSETDAQYIASSVHLKGKGIAGTYTREIAESKIEMAHASAKINQFPLTLTMEPNE
jgi:ATP-dependent Clp protease adaptor protein ClpS